MKYFAQKNNKQISGLTSRCQDALIRYFWPGNVRELKNVIERAVILNLTDKIDIPSIHEKIIQYIKNEKGKHFDPVLVDILIENIDKFEIIRDEFKDVFDG